MTALGVVGVVALLLALRAAEQSPDALDYALAARSGVGLFHPHHLLFSPLVRGVLALLAPLGRGGDAILAGQLHNVAWAVAALWALRALLRGATGSPRLADGAALGLLLTRGFWVYATQVEVYLPALGCLALVTWLVTRNDAGRPGPGATLAAGLLFGLAVLYHQTSVLYVAPLAVFCVAARGRAGWRVAGTITAIGGALALAAYLGAWLGSGGGGARTAAGFVRWTLDYAFQPVPEWGNFAHVGPTGIAALLRSQAANVAGVPDRFAPVVVPLFGVGLLGLAGWHVGALGRGAGARPLRLGALAWLAVHLAFFLWWLPTDTDFFVVSLLPLTILTALAAADLAGLLTAPGRLALGVGGAVALAVLGVGNLLATVAPLRASRGPDYAVAARLAAAAPPGCVIGIRFGVRENLRYYFDRAAIDLDLPLLAARAGRDPAADGPAGNGRLLVPIALLRPDREVGGHDARYEPQRWFAWLCWVTGATLDADGAPSSCRDVVRLDGDLALFGPARVPVDGATGLVALLDARLAPDGAAPWTAWLRASGAAGRLPAAGNGGPP
ncbi:MAG: hypothetical protein ACYDIE_11190 [Candidatus Krumholzibacteriia bacterium]